MDSFKDKVVLITGGSSGLGAATALRFARDGAKVVVAARRVEQSETVVRQINESGGEGFFIRTDVSKRADIEAMVLEALDRFGRLDCAVNNAGVGGPGRVPIAELEEEDWDKVMNVNLKGVFLCMKYEVRAMLKTGGGAIVNMASAFGLKPNNLGATPYGTSKFGVVGMTKIAAIDYGQQGIRINAICPGFAHSELVDPVLQRAPDLMRTMVSHYSAQNRIADADEIADAIAFLCSHDARFVNGAALEVDGGDRMRAY